MRLLVSPTEVMILKRISHASTILASNDYVWGDGVTRNLKIVAQGNNFYGYIDGEEVVSVTDDNITKDYTWCGIMSSKIDAIPLSQFDNFKVEAI